MTTNHRFSLNEQRFVIDMLNPANTGKGYCRPGDPEDDIHLRNRVLMVCLSEILSDLIISTEPMKKDQIGNVYRPFNEEQHSILVALLGAIDASQLAVLDPRCQFSTSLMPNSSERKRVGRASHQSRYSWMM
jgi:hypothetical protein